MLETQKAWMLLVNWLESESDCLLGMLLAYSLVAPTLETQ